MGKTINFNYKDVDYTLEYTRATVRLMEARGFNIDDIVSNTKPVTAIPMLFHGAFLAHHNPSDRNTKNPVDRKLADEIYSHITERTELITKLVSMYIEPMNDLIDNPAEDEGNLKWEANW